MLSAIDSDRESDPSYVAVFDNVLEKLDDSVADWTLVSDNDRDADGVSVALGVAVHEVDRFVVGEAEGVCDNVRALNEADQDAVTVRVIWLLQVFVVVTFVLCELLVLNVTVTECCQVLVILVERVNVTVCVGFDCDFSSVSVCDTVLPFVFDLLIDG